MTSMTLPTIVIAGPTCTGKSATAVKLALLLNGEIISADSVQVYRGMDIGSAKISEEEKEGIRHHLIDVADPSEPLNVIRFREMALDAMEDIRSRGKTPIVTGGTGFYIDSILFESRDALPGTDPEYRAELNARVDKGELSQLYEELKVLDPEYSSKVHPNNRNRVIRALEYCRTTGSKYSDYACGGQERKPRFPFRCFVLDDDRDALYSRINSRVDSMISNGLEREVSNLIESGIARDSVPMQAVGYRQMFDFLSGTLPFDEAVEEIKKETRHIAKRQLTWFRHTDYAEWIDVSEHGRDPYEVADRIIARL